MTHPKSRQPDLPRPDELHFRIQGLSYCDIFAENQGTLLGNDTRNSDATTKHVTLRHLTSRSTAGNGVLYAVRADSYVKQQERNRGKRYSLWASAEAIALESEFISHVALRVVGGDEQGTQCLGYNRATLLLEDINTVAWLSRLGESRIWDSKMWSWVPRDSALRMTGLARTNSNVNDRPTL
jgi:hypothetical protein